MCNKTSQKKKKKSDYFYRFVFGCDLLLHLCQRKAWPIIGKCLLGCLLGLARGMCIGKLSGNVLGTVTDFCLCLCAVTMKNSHKDTAKMLVNASL